MDWCTCAEAPVLATGPLTLLDHTDDCGYPESRCSNEDHHRLVHEGCGRPLEMRFCGCRGDTGYTLDPDRGWWVHVFCGWPTRAWYESTGSPAAPPLAGRKPVTWHPFIPIPRSPKAPWLRLTERQRLVNDEYVDRWVWD